MPQPSIEPLPLLEAETESQSLFANPKFIARSWYLAARSNQIRKGRARSFPLLNRKIVLYRDSIGIVRAMDARCPHVGADLGAGTVVGDGIQCAFHHWCIAPDGKVRSAPGFKTPPPRRVSPYSLVERWGLIWIYPGANPIFPFPEFSDPTGVRSLLIPPRVMPCHLNLVVGNALDLIHMETLHGLEFLAPPKIEVGDPYRITVHLQQTTHSRLLRTLNGISKEGIDWSFTVWGGSIALAEIRRPIPLRILFTGRPNPDGSCLAQIVLFLESYSPRYLFRVTTLLYLLLKDDHRVLDGLDFSRGFTDRDEPMRTYANLVDSLGPA